MSPPASEREHRWNCTRSAMREAGIDCLIVVGNSGLNLYRLADLQYLTGMPREGVLLFPLEGEPVMLSFGGGLDPEAWVTDHRNGYPRLFFVTRFEPPIKWMRSKTLRDREWALFVVHFDEPGNLLYLSSTDHSSTFEKLAMAVG